jgi:GxxExxY protein
LKAIIELKALSNIPGQEEAQMINFLKASVKTKKLLINFGAKQLQ